MEKLWTTSEAARFLGVHEGDVEQLVKAGKLTGYKLGGQFLRFRPDQVKALKEQGATAPRPEPAPPLRERRLERLLDAWYFYDFYILSFVLLAALVIYLISSG